MFPFLHGRTQPPQEHYSRARPTAVAILSGLEPREVSRFVVRRWSSRFLNLADAKVHRGHVDGLAFSVAIVLDLSALVSECYRRRVDRKFSFAPRREARVDLARVRGLSTQPPLAVLLSETGPSVGAATALTASHVAAILGRC